MLRNAFHPQPAPLPQPLGGPKHKCWKLGTELASSPINSLNDKRLIDFQGILEKISYKGIALHLTPAFKGNTFLLQLQNLLRKKTFLANCSNAGSTVILINEDTTVEGELKSSIFL